RFRAALEAAGVATGVHYPVPIPYQPAFAHLGYRRGDFPVTEDVMSHCVSLPMFPELTEDQKDVVVSSVRVALQNG
ncbi:MAG: DegT/DnrJ/EryC1/StrS family aminotransferase, partial [Planctomycetota bacterium]